MDMRMISRRACASLMVATCFFTLIPNTAMPCAGGAVSAGDVSTNAQRILIADHGDRTEVVVQVNVPATTSDYGILIPVPVEPVLDSTPVSSAELDALETSTRVGIVDQTDSGGGGCGSAADRAGGLGINVTDTVEIGPLTAVVLTASTGSALTSWLADNSFVLPAGASAIVDKYTTPGMYFIALRRSTMAATGAPSSLGVHFTLSGSQLTVPISIARLGAAASLSFVVFVASADSVSPDDMYEELTVDHLAKDLVRTEGYASGMRSSVSAAVEGRAFVVEGVFQRQDPALTGLGAQVANLLAPGQVLTRFSTVIDAAALSTDVTFRPKSRSSVPTVLDVTADDEGGCRATGGARLAPYLVLVAGLWILRRRRRAR